jgi:hypothetical protein
MTARGVVVAETSRYVDRLDASPTHRAGLTGHCPDGPEDLGAPAYHASRWHWANDD